MQERRPPVDFDEFCSWYCMEIEKILEIHEKHGLPINFEGNWSIDWDEYMKWLEEDYSHEEAIASIHGFVLKFWDEE